MKKRNLKIRVLFAYALIAGLSIFTPQFVLANTYADLISSTLQRAVDTTSDVAKNASENISIQVESQSASVTSSLNAGLEKVFGFAIDKVSNIFTPFFIKKNTFSPSLTVDNFTSKTASVSQSSDLSRVVAPSKSAQSDQFSSMLPTRTVPTQVAQVRKPVATQTVYIQGNQINFSNAPVIQSILSRISLLEQNKNLSAGGAANLATNSEADSNQKIVNNYITNSYSNSGGGLSVGAFYGLADSVGRAIENFKLNTFEPAISSLSTSIAATIPATPSDAFSTSTTRSVFSAGDNLSYDSSTGAFSLATSTVQGMSPSVSTSTVRTMFSSDATGLSYDSSTGIFSVTSGYNIPLTASTTEWASKVSSQWSTSGSNISYASGNVGIGTTTPSAALDVVGGINSAGTVTIMGTNAGAANLILSDDINGFGGIDIYSYQTTGSPYSYLNLIGSRGTADAPSQSLANDTLGELNFYGMGDGASSLLGARISSVAESDFDSNPYANLLFSTGNIERMRIANNGYVGIGTTSPAYQLEITGDFNTSAGTIKTSGTTRITNSGGFQGSVGNVSAPGFSFSVDTNTGVYRPVVDNLGLVVGGVEALRVDSSGNIGIGTSTPGAQIHNNISNAATKGLIIQAASGQSANFFETQSTNGTTGTRITSDHDLYLARPGTTNGLLFLNTNGFLQADTYSFRSLAGGSTYMSILSSGNVGIGNTSPSYKLDVTGGARIATGNTLIVDTVNPNPGANLSLIAGSSNRAYFGGNGVFGGQLTAATGELGISNTTVLRWSSDTTSYGTADIGFSRGAAGKLYLGNGTASDFSGTLIAGAIGIGTTTPSARLAITGTSGTEDIFNIASSTNASLFRIGATGATYFNNDAGTTGMVLLSNGVDSSPTWVATSSLGISGGGGSLSGGTSGYLARWTSASALSSGLLIDNGTVAGVNATSSSYAFNVQGSSGMNPFNVASSTGTSLFSILANGNVGIGTTTPANALTVIGVGHFTTGLAVGGGGATTTGTRLSMVPGTITSYSGSETTGRWAIGNGAITNGVAGVVFNSAGGSVSVNANGGGVGQSTQQTLSFYTANGTNLVERARFDTTGFFGIGTTSPLAVLSVQGSTTAPTAALFTLASSTGARLFTVTSAGNVGVGTSTPGYPLTVAGDVSFTGALRANGDAGTAGMVLLSNGVGSSPTWVATSSLGISGGGSSLTGTTGQFAYFSGTNTAVGTSTLFLSNGNIGIGTTTPESALSVVGTITTGSLVATSSMRVNGMLISSPAANSISIGESALSSPTNTTSIFMGYRTGTEGTSVTDSNFFGTYSGGASSNISNSNFMGYKAGWAASGASHSNFFGYTAGFGSSGGVYSNFLGYEAGRAATNAAYSNFFGYDAGYTATNAAYSNFFGYSAGTGATNARNSIFIGPYAGYNDTVNNANSSTSIAIGRYSGTGGFSNSIAIGHGVTNSAALQANFGNVLYLTGIYNSDTPSATPLSGGNVGIGSSTPYAKLTVAGEAYADLFSAGSTTATSTFAGGLNVGNGALTYNWASGLTNIANASLGAMSFDSDSGMISWIDMPVTSASASGTVQSYTAQLDGNPALSIYGLSDGAGGVNTLRLGVGTTTPVSALSVVGTINSTNLVGGASLSADANGNIILTPSDERLKQDIKPIESALDKVMNLQGVTFDWKDKARFGSSTEIGFIAQDVEKIVPELVRDGGEYKSLNYANMVALVVEAVKELKTRVDTVLGWFSSSGDRINIKGMVCVDEICVTKDQFKQMLMNSGSVMIVPQLFAPAPAAPQTTSDTTETSATSSTEDTVATPVDSSSTTSDVPPSTDPAPISDTPTVSDVSSTPDTSVSPVIETPSSVDTLPADPVPASDSPSQ